MSKILMIRHGITEGNKKKWFYGETDLPLIPEGIGELERKKEEGVYPELPEDALCFTTGKGRTAETFRVLFGDKAFEPIKELREINFGEFECKSFDELKDDIRFTSWTHDESGDYMLPGGDSANTFRARVKKGFEHLMERHVSEGSEMTVIVSHGGVIAEILHKLFPEEKESLWDWMPEPGSGYLLDVEDGKVINACLLGELTIY